MPRARRSSISRLREAKAKRAREFEKAHKAAEQGDAKAQFNLGIMYTKGEGAFP
jgi:TPR repeat protein